ncbi:FKBP-type peptidyl-prolyl cis-trans isomerase [Palaeococcus ferrophilus]|uniref:FKBP-type peptidyl-prolyl cis-trans isomerase n=1 Tax=Palaeococcus ferrophilus TaxID=83868 RepID=UPI0006500357
MKVAKGDVVRLSYTGKVRETGEVFDTTSEEIAKEAGIYKEGGVYGPVPIIIGAGHVLRGLDEALEGLEIGKKYEIEVPPEKGFGKRDFKLIKTLTLGQFKKHGVYPFPGLEVEIDGKRARVLSVSSGRVRVDFNHPLAGKTLIYEVEVVEKIDDPIEKVKALIELRLPNVNMENVIIEVGEKDVSINFGEQTVDPRHLAIGELLLEADLKALGYEKITFTPSVDDLLKPPEAKEEVPEEKVEEEASAENVEEVKEEAEETTEEAPAAEEKTEEAGEEAPTEEKEEEEPKEE